MLRGSSKVAAVLAASAVLGGGLAASGDAATTTHKCANVGLANHIVTKGVSCEKAKKFLKAILKGASPTPEHFKCKSLIEPKATQPGEVCTKAGASIKFHFPGG